MEKSKHALRAIVLIIIFSLLIILPPVFRVLFPKVEETVPKKQDRITTVTCIKEDGNKTLAGRVQIRYINNEIDQTRLTFTNNTIDPVIIEEITFLDTINGITKEIGETETVYTITKEVVDLNKDNIELEENYFNNDKIEATVYFTNASYTCEETTV